MSCGISGLLGGRFDDVLFNILITASPCGELADVPCGTVIALGVLAFAFGVAFLPLVDVVFLVVDFLGLAMILLLSFRLLSVHTNRLYKSVPDTGALLRYL
jgi:membrane protein implicated in regulation of membrane protease activity